MSKQIECMYPRLTAAVGKDALAGPPGDDFPDGAGLAPPQRSASGGGDDEPDSPKPPVVTPDTPDNPGGGGEGGGTTTYTLTLSGIVLGTGEWAEMNKD